MSDLLLRFYRLNFILYYCKGADLTTLLPRQVPRSHRISTTMPRNISSQAIAIQTPTSPKSKTIPSKNPKSTDTPHIEAMPRTVGNFTSPAAFILLMIIRKFLVQHLQKFLFCRIRLQHFLDCEYSLVAY